MHRRVVLPILLVAVLAVLVSSTVLVSPTGAVEVTAKPSPKGVVIQIDGQPFTEYLTQSGHKPICWPILGPTGKAMTRAYPMVKGQDETQDHPHQRSLWFTHGKVNEIDFWAEGPKSGFIVHKKFVKVAGGPQAVVATENDWIGPDKKKVCEDVRTLTFGGDKDSRWIDFDITIKATNGPVTFGDTKEGMFGVRMAETMMVDKKKGGKIINSEGQTNAKAWGQKAAWVDYFGPVEGEKLGIAIFNHPKSFRFPTQWHVRTYGLFAANPFGLHDYPNGEGLDGSHTIPSGQSITFHYRVLFHKGDEKKGKIAEAFAAYAKLPK